MLTLIRNAEVYAPKRLGKKDLLIAGGKIVRIGDRIDIPEKLIEREIDAAGRILTPGLVDYHMHFLGGGGGNGFSSRVPDLPFSEFTRAGVTTAVGCLGRDNHTRTMEGLLGKAKALDEDGITAFIYTGATLEHPIPTLTGSVRRDMVLCDKVIGVGEVSISELGPSHDTMGPGTEYIAKLAAEAFIAGRATGKAGILNLQVPPHGKLGMQPVFDILEKTSLPVRLFVPSHANSSRHYFDQAKRFTRMGGILDLCSNYEMARLGHKEMIAPVDAALEIFAEGISPELVTMSTDGNGAHPSADAGRSIYTPVSSLWEKILEMVAAGIALETCLPMVTANPARVIGLAGRKGTIAEAADADFLILREDLTIDKVVARGRLLVDGGEPLVRNQYEGIWRS